MYKVTFSWQSDYFYVLKVFLGDLLHLNKVLTMYKFTIFVQIQ